MPGVIVPQNQGSDTLGSLLKVGGTVVGGVFGGPAGAAAGYGLGSAAGGIISPPKAPIQPVQNSAIDRRVDTLSQDPNLQLAQAGAALKQLPPQDQATYGPTLAAAQQRAQYGGA